MDAAEATMGNHADGTTLILMMTNARRNAETILTMSISLATSMEVEVTEVVSSRSIDNRLPLAMRLVMEVVMTPSGLSALTLVAASAAMIRMMTTTKSTAVGMVMAGIDIKY